MAKRTKRFRASIYVDVYVEVEEEIYHAEKEGTLDEYERREKTLEEMRAEARKQVEEINNGIPNSYVGGVATFEGLKLDREI